MPRISLKILCAASVFQDKKDMPSKTLPQLMMFSWGVFLLLFFLVYRKLVFGHLHLVIAPASLLPLKCLCIMANLKNAKIPNFLPRR